MGAARSLLCIHRDPAQLSLLQEKGFSLLTATHVSQGLRLLASKPVDAVILEYHLGLLDGAAVADEIKKIRPHLPVVMLAESLELPEGALKSVDALVTNGDGRASCWKPFIRYCGQRIVSTVIQLLQGRRSSKEKRPCR